MNGAIDGFSYRLSVGVDFLCDSAQRDLFCVLVLVWVVGGSLIT
jgi:hypothetical protein